MSFLITIIHDEGNFIVADKHFSVKTVHKKQKKETQDAKKTAEKLKS